MLMRRIALASCVAALLAGCAVTSGQVSRSETVRQMAQRWEIKPEYQLDAVEIKWVRVHRDELEHATAAIFGADMGLGVDGSIRGFSIPPDPADAVKKCLIIAEMPRGHGDFAMEVLAHEILHCYLGRWHVPMYSAFASLTGDRASVLDRLLDVARKTPLSNLRRDILSHVDEWFPAHASEIKRFFATSRT